MVLLVRFCEKEKEYINYAALSATAITGAPAPNVTNFVYGFEKKGTTVPQILLFVRKEREYIIVLY